jgi:HNH endonuclease
MHQPDFESRLASFVDVGDCWLWTGATDKKGYGRVGDGGRTVNAHRWVWSNLVGPIPAGLVLDHLCRVIACVNPDHLEPVTYKVNSERGWQARTIWCKRGHDMRDPANLQITRSGWRQCRACQAHTARLRP